jgi:N-acetylmuramoyl-L-alanine amidase
MRQINQIIIHCSATPEGRDVTVNTIRQWHKQRGFRDIGYHYIIYRDGSVHVGRPESQQGAHCTGHNANSIGICYVGGMERDMSEPKDTRTPAQRKALAELCHELKRKYPAASIHGHNEFANKACPSFNVRQWKEEVDL